ncbi:hypothetical protein, partial [Pseudomonas viridiflava]|uniref:hypothetical protein n=1 Tax=Pseudomonas viridiflava TaxID=33069 RepID=UPI0023F6FF96
AKAGRPVALPAKTRSLKACAQHLSDQATQPALQAQVPFWEASLADQPVALPASGPQGPA